MPIKKPNINESLMENLKNDPRNRKRGKGKIKIVKRQHVDNDELEQELINYKKTGIASERLGELFLDLVENYATKSNYSGYSYLEEMKSKAIYFLLSYSKGFNPNLISKRTKQKVRAFAYCTQFVYHAFLQVIRKENRHEAAIKGYVDKYFREKDFFKKDDNLIN